MIETKESVLNLNEILENKNLDLVYIGPYDLSISYGVNPNKVFDTKEMINLYLHILKLAKLKKKKVASPCSAMTLRMMPVMKLTRRLLLISVDWKLGLVRRGHFLFSKTV